MGFNSGKPKENHPCLGYKWWVGAWGLNNGKPKVKIFLGKLFHPYVGYNKWWQGGGGRVWGLIMETQGEKLFLEKLFHPCLGYKWWQGGGGRVWGLIMETQGKAIFRKAIPSMSWLQVVARACGVGLTNGLQGRWVGRRVLLCHATWCDLEACVRLGATLKHGCSAIWCGLEIACVRLGTTWKQLECSATLK